MIKAANAMNQVLLVFWLEIELNNGQQSAHSFQLPQLSSALVVCNVHLTYAMLGTTPP